MAWSKVLWINFKIKQIVSWFKIWAIHWVQKTKIISLNWGKYFLIFYISKINFKKSRIK